MEADDLVWQDAIGLARLISEGTVSAVEVVAATSTGSRRSVTG
ncbi:hypothetical protein ACIPW9_19610 [Streptomyces sp. NPDC090052]|nr:hypothetical protein [Streptomyces sp. NBC_01306]MCX4729023.1 hypothetical protein [Streptomyces sp. NBC_01306]WSX46266.1 hypothetical protein OG760_33740 [Streptomyces sp. NBC_00963]